MQNDAQFFALCDTDCVSDSNLHRQYNEARNTSASRGYVGAFPSAKSGAPIRIAIDQLKTQTPSLKLLDARANLNDMIAAEQKTFYKENMAIPSNEVMEKMNMRCLLNLAREFGPVGDSNATTFDSIKTRKTAVIETLQSMRQRESAGTIRRRSIGPSKICKVYEIGMAIPSDVHLNQMSASDLSKLGSAKKILAWAREHRAGEVVGYNCVSNIATQKKKRYLAAMRDESVSDASNDVANGDEKLSVLKPDAAAGNGVLQSSPAVAAPSLSPVPATNIKQPKGERSLKQVTLAWFGANQGSAAAGASHKRALEDDLEQQEDVSISSPASGLKSRRMVASSQSPQLEPTAQNNSEGAPSSTIATPTREILMERFHAAMSRRTQDFTDLATLESMVNQVETWGWIFDPFPLF
jgi:hypothetical protein